MTLPKYNAKPGDIQKMNKIVKNKKQVEPRSFGSLSLASSKESKLGTVNVSDSKLVALNGCPDTVSGSFHVYDNQSLTSLEGGPKEVGKDYIADRCSLTSLEGLPSKIGGRISLSRNPLTSLQGINKLKEMKGEIYLNNCPINSHILGVFFIKGCLGINAPSESDFGHAVKIVNSHISKGRAGLLPCQRALIEAGLHDFAQI
jgi:hypothetical protein